MAQPFYSGKDATFRLFIDGDEVILNCKTWKATLTGQKSVDQVNGEDRGRPQFIPDLWEFTADCYCSNNAHVKKMLKYVQNTDDQAQPFDTQGLISTKTIGGPTDNFGAKEMCVDDFSLSQGGRSERVMYNFSARARYFDPLPSSA